ncbi:uncharacterized protein UV8b_01849 [Ustilaginoidea virens]|uniref:Acetylxylan esterase n=1 Tax=Ustilaginoidea virens TaxID=1159556 RepID=A0A8E5HLR7_USTVR|nr:uncharacterized protein UV8b_01849 [Ustilaginoidea virens]QUC17608.1 hypothetical protein UV8b_01849 [Ustilaginoidea virens]
MRVDPSASLALVLLGAAARAMDAAACPPLHLIVARGTGQPPGYDKLITTVNQIKSDRPGTTSEALDYPACGGSPSCGGYPYQDSVRIGVAAAVRAVEGMHRRCPQTKLVVMGYSQGGELFDDALCGGGDVKIPDRQVPLSDGAVNMIKAAIFMGNPRFQSGFSYEVGTCRGGGFDARPRTFGCPKPTASKIQSYCDLGDPYCCRGRIKDEGVHARYVQRYEKAALTFIYRKLDEK